MKYKLEIHPGPPVWKNKTSGLPLDPYIKKKRYGGKPHMSYKLIDISRKKIRKIVIRYKKSLYQDVCPYGIFRAPPRLRKPLKGPSRRLRLTLKSGIADKLTSGYGDFLH